MLGRVLLVAVVGAVALLPARSVAGADRVPARAAQGSCAGLGALPGYDVFVAGNINASNNQLQGAAAAGGAVTLSSYGISVALPADPARLDLIAGGDLNVSNASAHGSVRYGGTLTGSITVPPGGSVAHGPYPFSFPEEVAHMELLSATWAALPASGTASPSGELLALNGTLPGLNIFHVTSGQLQSARNITINVPAGASALVNVSGSSYSTAVSGTYGAGNRAVPTIWNFTEASRVQIGPGTGMVRHRARAQRRRHRQQHPDAQLRLGARLEGTGTILNGALPECLPPPTQAIALTALCVNPVTNELAMRLTNGGDAAKTVTWSDEDSAQRGVIDAGPRTDSYFHVLDGDQPHTIVAQAGSERARAEGTTRPCQGTVLVHKSTSGEGTPPGGGWQVTVSGDSGYSDTEEVTAGATATFTVPSNYQAGSLPIGGAPSGYLYTVSEPDPRGAVATVDPELVPIVDGESETVGVDNRYDPPEPEVKPEPEPKPPIEPPVEPPPLPGEPTTPSLAPSQPGHAGTDLMITQHFSRSSVPLHGTFEVVVHVRNLSMLAAADTVVSELPQAHPLEPNRVVQILSISSSCTRSQPATCQLGTLQPGADVLLHARVKAQLIGSLTSDLRVTTSTPEVNTTNNIATAGIVVTPPPARLAVAVSAPAQGPVGVPLSYRVRASVGGAAGAMFVRICQRPPGGLLVTSAPGTFRSKGEICRDVDSIAHNGSAGFTVQAIPAAAAAGRTLVLPAQASAPGLHTAHGQDAVAIVAEALKGNG